MEAPPDGEFDAWVAQHVPLDRRAQLRDAADSLSDLRCCDIDDLDDALELLQWPEPERRRFLEAWRELCAEAPSAPSIDPAAYERSPFRRGQLVLVPAEAFGDDYAAENPETLSGTLICIKSVERDEAGEERRIWDVQYETGPFETDESFFDTDETRRVSSDEDDTPADLSDEAAAAAAAAPKKRQRRDTTEREPG